MAGHKDATITIQLTGQAADADPRLDDFLEEMQAVRVALRETERLVSGQEPSLYFRIKRLQKQSPTEATLEAVSDVSGERSTPQYASYIVRRLTTNLRVIANRKRLPAQIDPPTLAAYRELSAPTEKHRLEVRIQVGKHAVLINPAFREILDKLVGEDEFSYGSISGKIEAVNLHTKPKTFQLFPTVGPRRLLGTFRAKDRKRFANGLDRYVTVYGRLRYKLWDKYPYAIKADDITVHEMEPPTLNDLRGVAPDATGSLTTQEYIDRLRDED